MSHCDFEAIPRSNILKGIYMTHGAISPEAQMSDHETS